MFLQELVTGKKKKILKLLMKCKKKMNILLSNVEIINYFLGGKPQCSGRHLCFNSGCAIYQYFYLEYVTSPLNVQISSFNEQQ